MRMTIKFIAEQSWLPKDYRAIMLSVFKHCLLTHAPDFFEQLYQANNSAMKGFTFAAKLKKPVFERDIVRLAGNDFSITWSTADTREAITFYNAILAEKFNRFPLAKGNGIRPVDITVMPTRNIEQGEVVIKLRSPLVVREHNRDTGADYYYDYSDRNFMDKLKVVTARQASQLQLFGTDIEMLSLEPVTPKRTVIPLFGNKINVSLGVYKLTGDKKLINFLYNSGIGSRRSAGFGLFDILA
jgi:CRISPR-associated endoribonuclease Cas6